MASPARVIAAEVLTRVERDGAYASVSLDAAFAAAPQMDPRDTALASELVLGTLRRKLALDAALESAADRRMSEIEPLLQPLLRLGAYQLLYLDRVPAHAAVFETVELCKERGFGRAAGLCNAALRRLSRDPKVPLPSEPLQRLSVEESHPLWLVRRWVERLGLEQTAALCRANNQPAPLNLRVNARRGTRDTRLSELRAARPEASIAAGQFAPTAISLTGVGPVTRLPGFAEGGFQVQDEAAQLVGRRREAPRSMSAPHPVARAAISQSRAPRSWRWMSPPRSSSASPPKPRGWAWQSVASPPTLRSCCPCPRGPSAS